MFLFLISLYTLNAICLVTTGLPVENVVLNSTVNDSLAVKCVSLGNNSIVDDDDLSAKENNASYWIQRDALLHLDYSSKIGHDLVLSSDEMLVNFLLTDVIKQEMSSAFTSLKFPPARNFMLTKPEIDSSQVFAFIQAAPKGAVLHVHDLGMASMEFVVSELTYWDNLYMCNNTGILIFRFSASAEVLHPCFGEWHLVAEERANYSSSEAFDKMLYQQMTIVTDTPDESYPDVNTVWRKFEECFITISGILLFRPAFEVYISRTLFEYMRDGICYIEFRGILTPLYELNGTVLDVFQSMQVYKDVIDLFMLTNSQNFFGARFIFAPHKFVNEEKMYEYLSLAVALRERFPELVIGFDLVGQEDVAPPLKTFIAPLLSLSAQNISLPVFYHAGETNWYGLDSDENILDALLLNASRIGHGYAITKHPALMDRAMLTDTPIEVCPISNQVLGLIKDLRNHPAVSLTTSGFPLVISSDDPGMWGALPLSHDFYEAIMAFGGARADLKLLKQLALNSIKYSSLSEDDKSKLQIMWEKKWEDFIQSAASLLTNEILK